MKSSIRTISAAWQEFLLFFKDYDEDIDSGKYKCCIVNYLGRQTACDAETFVVTTGI